MADVTRPQLRDAGRPSIPARLEGLIRTALPKGALILSVVTFVNYALGWLETKVISHQFGAGTDAGAFTAAFLLPSMVLDILVVGGLLASFVPLYTGLKDESVDQARAFARTILTLAVVVTTAAMAVLAVFAQPLVSFFFPGLLPQQHDLCVDLFRILAFAQIIWAATWVLGEVLIAERSWFPYALAQVSYSLGIIAGAVLFGDLLGIYAAAWGAVVGMAGYLAIRLAGAWRTGFRPRPSFDIRAPGLSRYFRLMWPKMLSQPLEGSLTALYFVGLATTLSTGAPVYLRNAFKFETMAVLVIGTQFAIASFPSLSTAADTGKRRDFRRLLGTNLATVAVLSTLAAFCLLVLGGLAVSILLGGGEYTASDVHQTAMLLAVFAIAVPLESMVEVVARGMYATKNTIIPTIASVAGFVTLFVVSQLLIHPAGLLALPASYALGMAVKLGIIWMALIPRADRIGRPVAAPAEPKLMAHRGYGSTRRSATPQIALAVLAAVVVAGAGLYTGIQALNGASFGFAPEVTPWARVRAAASEAAPTIAPTTPTVQPSASGPSPNPSASASASPTAAAPSGSPTPAGQFAMDLYQSGDFIGEYKNTYCTPAAMQTMMNIMDTGADTSTDTQDKLFALANSLAESRNGSPDPEGWSGGLQKLGYGNYKIGVDTTMDAALKNVVKQIRLTNRPAGLLVWKGWHSWVVSGFVADADPAVTDNFKIKALNIEDVWYNRHSTLWNKTRGGYSRPPDSLVPYSEMSQDYVRWDQAVYYRNKQHNWVYVLPY